MDNVTQDILDLLDTNMWDDAAIDSILSDLSERDY